MGGLQITATGQGFEGLRRSGGCSPVHESGPENLHPAAHLVQAVQRQGGGLLRHQRFRLVFLHAVVAAVGKGGGERSLPHTCGAAGRPGA